MFPQRIVTALTVALVTAATAAAVVPTAHAATKPLPSSMVLYSISDYYSTMDFGVPGPSDGDEHFRHGRLTRTTGGPTVGEYFFKSVTVRTDALDGLEWREITKEFVLPGGTIQVSGINRDSIGQLPAKGQTQHDVIIGGTGDYRGARGELIGTVIQESPWIYKNQFLFVK
jgi:hypothetical protein